MKTGRGPPKPLSQWRPAADVAAGDLRTPAWDIDSNIDHPGVGRQAGDKRWPNAEVTGFNALRIAVSPILERRENR
jgi:hypothetical protein